MNNLSDAEQYLDLIAENAQIKAEIQSLKTYGNLIRYYDRQILKICSNQALGKNSEIPQLDQTISKINLGIPPVESAESFKQIMIAERNSKSSEKHKALISKYNMIKENLQKKYDTLQNSIQLLESTINEHNQKISESEIIQDNFQNQINEIQKSISESNIKLTTLHQEVENLQAFGLELKRSSDKAQRELSQYIKSGEMDSKQTESIIQVVNNLKKINSYSTESG